MAESSLPRVTSPPPSFAAMAVLAMVVGFAFGRFAYGALLPSIRGDLGLSYTAAGALATLNLFAYLAGAQLARYMLRRCRPATLIIVAMGSSAGVFAAWAITSVYWMAVGIMMAQGVFSAMIWISVIQLARDAVAPGRQGRFLGIAGLGPAWGIPMVAIMIGGISAVAGKEAWRWSWAAMSGVAALGAALARPVLRRQANLPRLDEVAGPPGKLLEPATVRLLLAYLFYGAWFSIFATFVVSYLRDGGMSARTATGVWAVLGVVAGIGTVVFGRWCDVRPPRSVAVAGFCICVISAAGLSVGTSWMRPVLVAVVGFPMVGTGTALTVHTAQLFVEDALTSRVIAAATALNGLGQALGPLIAGPTIDATDSYSWAFVVAATFGAAAVAALVVARGRRGGTSALSLDAGAIR